MFLKSFSGLQARASQLLLFILVAAAAAAAAAAAQSLESCPTVCDPMDGSLSGSPVPGILQARTLEWVPSYAHGIK